MEVRLAQVRLEEERRREQLRREEEHRLRREQDSKDREVEISAVDLFPPPDDGTFFNVRAAVEKRKTTLYCYKRTQALLENDQVRLKTPEIDFDSMGGKEASQATGTTDFRRWFCRRGD